MTTGIYKITAPDGKIYIGQAKDIWKRKAQHFSVKRFQNNLLYKYFEKFGKETHIFEIVEECSLEILNERERHYQDLYDVCGDNGLNCVLTKTDDLPAFTRYETKKQRSEWIKNRVFTEEYRKNLSEANKRRFKEKGLSIRQIEVLNRNHELSKGRTPWNKGSTTSQETKEKISATCKSNPNVWVPKNSLMVLNVVTGIYYDSIADAARTVNISGATIQHNLCGYSYKNKTDFIFAYPNIEAESRRNNKIISRQLKKEKPFKRKSQPGVLVLDLTTGIYYDSIQEAATALKMKKTTLHAKLTGQNRNNTSFIYA